MMGTQFREFDKDTVTRDRPKTRRLVTGNKAEPRF